MSVKVGFAAVIVLSSTLFFLGCSGESGPSQAEIQAQKAAQRAASAAESAQAEAETAQEQVKELEQKLAKERMEQSQEKGGAGASTGSTQPSSPPNVVGLTLPKARKVLRNAGFSADARNTDTTFGILIPQNFTICKQDSPRGRVVPVLAQKYGC